MIKLLRRVHFFYFTFWITLTAIIFWPLFYWGTRKPSRYLMLNKLRSAHAYVTTIFTFIFVDFKFETPLDDNQTYIYCANHTSNLDILLLCMLGKGRFHFMGKEELLKNPVLGIFFKTIDITVSRESKISAFKAFKKAGENLDKGMSLIIFPEGKIDEEYPPILNEFKNGPFRLAIVHQIPIVPISIVNVWQLMWDNGFKYGTRPGIVEIYVHTPISTLILAADNDDDLKEQVYNKINSKL